MKQGSRIITGIIRRPAAVVSRNNTVAPRRRLSIVDFIASFQSLHEVGAHDSKSLSMSHVYTVLLQRSMLVLTRDKSLIFSRFKYLGFYAMVLALVWTPLRKDQQSIQNRIGILQLIISMGQAAGFSVGISSVRREKSIVAREYTDHLYSSITYFLAYFTVSIPLLIIPCFIFAVFMVYVIHLGGFPSSIVHLFQFTYVMFCLTIFGECIGVFFTSVVKNTGAGGIFIGIITSFTSKSDFPTLHLLSPSVPRFLFCYCRFDFRFSWSSRTSNFSLPTIWFSSILGQFYSCKYCISRYRVYL
jgi:hypothetical protein